jgi:hypothetical protein
MSAHLVVVIQTHVEGLNPLGVIDDDGGAFKNLFWWGD